MKEIIFKTKTKEKNISITELDWHKYIDNDFDFKKKVEDSTFHEIFHFIDYFLIDTVKIPIDVYYVVYKENDVLIVEEINCYKINKEKLNLIFIDEFVLEDLDEGSSFVAHRCPGGYSCWKTKKENILNGKK